MFALIVAHLGTMIGFERDGFPDLRYRGRYRQRARLLCDG